ncbi:hypothetical protein AKO1_007045 [Acrasis kona]|uniref:Uncharacterized protein n=1 Tax=Acrasis kona TaxID=1008807 RepID=A0AAW2YX19_9EUKA
MKNMLIEVGDDILYEIFKFLTEDRLAQIQHMDCRLADLVNVVLRERLITFYSPFIKSKQNLEDLVNDVIKQVEDSQSQNHMQDDMQECEDDFFERDFYQNSYDRYFELDYETEYDSIDDGIQADDFADSFDEIQVDGLFSESRLDAPIRPIDFKVLFVSASSLMKS